MGVAPYLDVRIAPKAIFDHLPERAARPRYMVPEREGWRPVTYAEHASEIERCALYLSGCARRGPRGR